MLLVLCQLVGMAFAVHQELCLTEQEKQHCFGRSCGVELAGFELKLSDACACTPADIGYESTKCDPVTDRRNIIFFWKPPATCIQRRVALPAPLIGIPCAVLCPAGQYLSVNRLAPRSAHTPVNESQGHVDTETRCETCEPGQYSLGGGVIFEEPWTKIPAQFFTSCSMVSSRETCAAWSPEGPYIHSGENNGKDKAESILGIELDLARDGNVSFDFKFEAETGFDKFYFEVDGWQVLEFSELAKVWTHSSHPLSAGHHSLKWIYKKDASVSIGEDKVFLSSIRIDGYRFNDLHCTECPPGRYGPEAGMGECLPCAAGTFSNHFGGSSCPACHKWETSFPGSDHCLPNLPCNEADITSYLSPCDNGTQTRSFAWIEPRACASGEHLQHGQVSVPWAPNQTHAEENIDFFFPFNDVPVITDLHRVVGWTTEYGREFSMSATNLSVAGFTMQIDLLADNRGEDAFYAYNAYQEHIKFLWAAAVNGSGMPLGEDVVEACQPESCQLGEELDVDTGRCRECSAGRVSTGVDPCEQCPSGQGTGPLHWRVNRWLKGEALVSLAHSVCSGDCGTEGWRMAVDYIDTGVGHGTDALSTLTLTFDTRTHPVPLSVSFNLAMSCRQGTARMEFFFDDILMDTYYCSGCEADPEGPATPDMYHSYQLMDADPTLMHVLRWSYRKLDVADFSHGCDRARLLNVSLMMNREALDDYAANFFQGDEGVVGGPAGASECMACSNGRFSKGGLCLPCKPGTFSETGATACKPCPEGSFAHKAGMSSCLKCGKGTIANAARTACNFDCRFRETLTEGLHPVGRTYDISALTPVPVAVDLLEADVSLFLSLCTPFLPDQRALEDLSAGQTADQAGIMRGGMTMEQLRLCQGLEEQQWTAMSNDHVLEEDEENARELTPTLPVRACAVTEAQDELPVEAGSAGAIVAVESRSDSSVAGLVLTLSEGVMECQQGAGPAKTTIELICDMDAGVGNPLDVTSATNASNTGLPGLFCDTAIVWRSAMACPICTDLDMDYSDGGCGDDAPGVLTRTYFWRNPKRCFRGRPLLAQEAVECDPNSVPDSHVLLSRALVMFVAALVGSGGVLALVLIACLVLRHRRLYSQYARLQGTGGGGDTDLFEFSDGPNTMQELDHSNGEEMDQDNERLPDPFDSHPDRISLDL